MSLVRCVTDVIDNYEVHVVDRYALDGYILDNELLKYLSQKIEMLVTSIRHSYPIILLLCGRTFRD